jgi:HSP20 family protein
MKPLFTLSNQVFKPAVDIYETPDQVIVRIEIAGVDKDNFSVELSRTAVRVRGIRKELTRKRDAVYRLAEIQYGPFERVLRLPRAVDPEVASTVYKNGFLELHLAKSAQPKVYKIEVTESD